MSGGVPELFDALFDFLGRQKPDYYSDASLSELMNRALRAFNEHKQVRGFSSKNPVGRTLCYLRLRMSVQTYHPFRDGPSARIASTKLLALATFPNEKLSECILCVFKHFLAIWLRTRNLRGVASATSED